MSCRSTKHHPRAWDAPPPRVLVLDMPKPVDRKAFENESVSLGLREPPEGRYTTLSRLAYQHGRGDSTPSVQEHDDITHEHKSRTNYMRDRHFYLPEKEHFLMSETRGSHIQPSKELLEEAAAGGHHGAFASRMIAHNMFISERSMEEWKKKSTSTNRADFGAPSVQLMHDLKDEARNLKTLQQGTHFILGTRTEPVDSEKRALFQGNMDPEGKRKKILSATIASVNIGSSDVKTADTYRSLKQVDFVKHDPDSVARPGNNTRDKHNVVLGYYPDDITSVSRENYVPTKFVFGH